MIKRSLKFILPCLVALILSGSHVKAQTTKINILKIHSPKDLHEFFKYTGHDIPLVSGHRGGREQNAPENSIASFENTLIHTPAFFEIDPRLTKDSVIVVMHDATLERTTTGKGKVSDYTWAELQQLNLKDASGNVTKYHIPTLAEAIEWARGKTILSLDWKGVPYQMTADLIRKRKAVSFVMIGIHELAQMKFYLSQDKGYMFAKFIDNVTTVSELESAGIPLNQVMAYVGPVDKPENQQLYGLLHQKGMMCMVAAAPVYDKLPNPEARKRAYRGIVNNKVDIIESDLPIEVAAALQEFIPTKSSKSKFFGTIKL